MINQNFSQQILKKGDEKVPPPPLLRVRPSFPPRAACECARFRLSFGCFLAQHEFGVGNPFAQEGEEVASVAYRYRKFAVSEDINMLVRCQIDGVVDPKEGETEKQFMTTMALNEFDPKATGVDWRRKLEAQRGAVLANELKNNSNKLGRWTTRSILAGADVMKLGFVSRTNPAQKWQHQILSSQFYKPREFARQINLNLDNMWGILRYVVDLVRKQEQGK